MEMKGNWWGGCFFCVIHEENNHVILPDTRMMYMCTIQILRFLFVLRKKVNYFLCNAKKIVYFFGNLICFLYLCIVIITKR